MVMQNVCFKILVFILFKPTDVILDMVVNKKLMTNILKYCFPIVTQETNLTLCCLADKVKFHLFFHFSKMTGD